MTKEIKMEKMSLFAQNEIKRVIFKKILQNINEASEMALEEIREITGIESYEELTKLIRNDEKNTDVIFDKIIMSIFNDDPDGQSDLYTLKDEKGAKEQIQQDFEEAKKRFHIDLIISKCNKKLLSYHLVHKVLEPTENE